MVSPSLPPRLLMRMASHPSHEARLRAVARSRCPPEVLWAFAADLDARVRRRISERRDCPGWLLARLAHDEDAGVRRRVARHPQTPPDAAGALAADTDKRVRLGVAERASLPRAAMWRLACDSDPSVRFEMVAYGAPDAAAIMALTADQEPDVAAAAKMRGWHEAYHAAGRDNDAQTQQTLLRWLLTVQDQDLRQRAAQCVSIPMSATRQMLADADTGVVSTAASRICWALDSGGADIDAAVAVGGDEAREMAAGHHACSPDTLARLVSDPVWSVVVSAAQHPKCPPSARREALEDPFIRRVLEIDADNMGSGGDRFAEMVYSAERLWCDAGWLAALPVFGTECEAQRFALEALSDPALAKRHPQAGLLSATLVVRFNSRLRKTVGMARCTASPPQIDIRPGRASLLLVAHEMAHHVVHRDARRSARSAPPLGWHGLAFAAALLDLVQVSAGTTARTELLRCLSEAGAATPDPDAPLPDNCETLASESPTAAQAA